GQTGPAEYTRAWHSTQIFYSPLLTRPPANVRLVATSLDLYFLAEHLPLHASQQVSKLALSFDTAAGAGRQPTNSTLQFVLGDDGTSQTLRGGGQNGFFPDPAIKGWSASRGQVNDTEWNAEFRI